MGDAGHVADGGEDVQVGHHGVDRRAPEELGGALGATEDEQDAGTVVGQVALHLGEGDPVVGGEDDEGALRQLQAVEGLQDLPDGAVQDAGAGLEVGHVPARLRSIRQGGRGRQ